MTPLALVSLLLMAVPPTPCESCAGWNASQAPFKIYGNTYYVGVRGLSSLLITSDVGHVLIDGGLPESAEKVAANIRALGFRVEDVKLIVNSHIHFDHAGGLAELQLASKARVVASPKAAQALRSGKPTSDDPQATIAIPIAKVPRVDTVRDGETVNVGPLQLTVHFTPGHTPGGTSWTWTSCENGRCLGLVYADSITPVSADGYRFSDHPATVADFEKSFATLSTLRCDVLVAPHPEATDLWARLAKRDQGEADAFVDPKACARYAEAGRGKLQKRLTSEK